MYVNNLSFDPRDPYYDIQNLPGVQWSIQVFTTHNLYGLALEHVQVTEIPGGIRLTCSQLSWGGQQQRSDGRVEVDLCSDNGAFVWTAQAWHQEPIKAIKLILRGLPESALAKGWWQPTSDQKDAFHPTQSFNQHDFSHPIGTLPLLWRYPWPEWLTPWACAGDASEAICISVRDPEVRAKRLYVYRTPYINGDVVELICEEDAARWGNHLAAPSMRVHLCHGAADLDADFAAHLTFVEQAFQLQPWESRPDVPAWLRDIRLVLNLHGQHWTGYVFNTFDRMAETLRFITQYIPGEQLLVYIPGWEGRYYFAYPYYQPGEAMGGAEAFSRLVQTTHELGAKVMPMFGMHGANTQLYPDWKQAAFKSRTSDIARFVNFPDWDNDRFGEDDQVFLNPGEPTYRNHLLGQVSAVVRDYEVDGVFLDTSACWFNAPDHNLVEGYRILVEELHQRHPGLLVAGEGWYDAMLKFFAINQTWLGVERHYRYPQLLTRYARAIGHLANGTPGHGSTGVHEGGYYSPVPQVPTPGHIPSLGIVDDTLARYQDIIIQVCQAAAGRPTG